MEFTRQRRKKNDRSEKYIVYSHVSIIKKVINFLVSVVMWMYILVVIEFFMSGLLDYHNDRLRVLKSAMKIDNQGIRGMICMTVCVFLVSFIALSAWKFYNKSRYGKLNRRRMPMPTSDKDMLELNLVEPEMYYQLKSQRISILEKSPIRDLYEAEDETSK